MPPEPAPERPERLGPVPEREYPTGMTAVAAAARLVPAPVPVLAQADV